MVVVFLCNSVHGLVPHCTNVFITDEGFLREVLQCGVALMCISAIFCLWPFVKYSSVLFVRSQETSVHCTLLRNSVYVALA